MFTRLWCVFIIRVGLILTKLNNLIIVSNKKKISLTFVYSRSFVAGTEDPSKNSSMVFGRFTHFSYSHSTSCHFYLNKLCILQHKLHASTTTPRLWYASSDKFCGVSSQKVRFVSLHIRSHHGYSIMRCFVIE